MLKYKVLADDAVTDNISIPVETYKTISLNGHYFHKKKCYFVTEDTENIAKNTNVKVLHKILVQNGLILNLKDIDDDGNKVYYDPVNDYDEYIKARAKYEGLNANDSLSKYLFDEVLNVLDTTNDPEKINSIFGYYNVNTMMFTTMIDRFFRLNAVKVSYISDDVIYVFFKNTHFFNPNDKNVYLWLHFTENGVEVNAKMECKYANSSGLKIVNLKPVEVVDNTGSEITTVSASIISELLKNDSLWQTISYMRETPFYVADENGVKLDNFILYTINPKRKITIGLSKSDGINMMQSDFINTFVTSKKDDAINNINEMEKDVYHPVILKTSFNPSGIPSDVRINYIKEVYSIKFNLHFREHRGDDWLVEPDSYWNGTTKDEDGKLTLMKSEYNGARFFYDIENADSQSDLLSYLNFTDDDVKYRKNRLKKSFLRLSFYDSTNPANQNLLAYSTIFVDSGNLFGSYLKYGGFSSSNNSSDSGDYMSLTYGGDGISGKANLTGIRVNREYNGTRKNVEERRLSSQFVVEERGTTDSSSEGFYLYLWKDNDGGIVPSDIYMKVEFNHAGYGRTIPFMMPYWDKNTTSEGCTKSGIKSFEDIVADWNNDTKDCYLSERDTRYTVKDYAKYSYIKLKYRYDKENERHIYYLDDTVYGESAYFTDNTITLNLYEAKII